MRPETIEKFMACVSPEPMSGCWLWTGTCNWRGYGQFSAEGAHGGAHLFAYRAFVGPIAASLEIDHLCRVRPCVNPRHLEAVTHTENVRRAMKTHCPQGHCYAQHAWVRYREGQPVRECRICKVKSNREWRRARAALAKATGESR